MKDAIKPFVAWGFARAVETVAVLALVEALALCPMLGQSTAIAAEDHAEGEGGAAQTTPGNIKRPNKPKGGPDGSGPCAIDPQRLANAANGVGDFDYSTVVNFLGNPTCAPLSTSVSQRAIQLGVSFSDKAPWRLDIHAQGTLKGDIKARDKSDIQLQESVPTLLRQYPLGSSELLPLIGQLSLLSPGAARSGLVELSQQQLYTADSLLNVKSAEKKDMPARVAGALLQLGVNRGPIMEKFAESVQEMAVLAQADSLGKIFRALGAAAVANNALVSTFNLSAGALNRGVAKGSADYSIDARTGMLKAVFSAVKAANESNEMFQPAMVELNGALQPLMAGYPLTETALKQAWRDVLALLSVGSTQEVLSEAVALSLTPEILFLGEKERFELVLAARNYHPLAVAVQENFIAGYNRLYASFERGQLRRDRFKFLRKKFMKPWVASLLELGPQRLTRQFMVEAIRAGLVEDGDVEQKFPLFVLAHLQRGERASLVAAAADGPEGRLASMAESFAVLYTLSRIHLPMLMKWVERYDPKGAQ